MLGRGVGERILTDGPDSLFAPELVTAVRNRNVAAELVHVSRDRVQ